jgi:uncharacterized protein involved in exopolysaccharide biosynthesis
MPLRPGPPADGAQTMDVLPHLRSTGPAPDGEPVGVARRGNRRRLAVFAAVFVTSLLAGQAWNYSRADEYRASSRLQVNVPDAAGAGAAASAAWGTHLQILDSRPLLQTVAQRMTDAGLALSGTPEEAVDRLQAMLGVQPVAGTDVVQLVATGEVPAQLAGLLNSIPDVLRSELQARQAGAADDELGSARQELLRLEAAAAERRAALDQFRLHAGLLAERDENEAVARSKGLSNSLNVAVEKEAAAAARLQALVEGTAAGRSGVQARDDPTLAALEVRASQVREELREMERSYTPEFMALDPRARAAATRLAELERQIAQQRVVGRQASVQAAEEELANARALVERVRGQLATARPELQGASARFARAKLLEEDLAQVESTRREMLAKVELLQADERRRMPSVAVLDPAVEPTVPYRPQRTRDGLWILGASVLLALFAMGLVEVFNRAPGPVSQPSSTTLVLSPGWGGRVPALRDDASTGHPLLTADGTPSPRALPAPLQALQQPEAAALLAAAPGPARFVCTALLMGLTAQEVSALRGTDIDAAGLRLRVPGAWSRALPMPAWLAATLPAAVDADAPLLHDASGEALTDADLQALVALAAVDAGLPQGASLSAEALRDTCIAWLLGQGLRFSELPALVGRIDADRVAAFAAHGTGGPRRQAAEIDFLMPALRLAPTDQDAGAPVDARAGQEGGPPV